MNSITEISERLNSMIKVVRFGKSKFHPEVEFTFANEIPFVSLKKTVDNLPKKEYAMVTFGISDSKF